MRLWNKATETDSVLAEQVSSLVIVVLCVVMTTLDPPTSEAAVPLSSREHLVMQLTFLGLLSCEWTAKLYAYGFWYASRMPYGFWYASRMQRL